MVLETVPGVVNSDKQQEQRRGAHRKQRLVLIPTDGKRREGQQPVRDVRQDRVKEPILEYGFIDLLFMQASGYDYAVDQSVESENSPQNGA